MLLAGTTLTIDPVWPWSVPGMGLPILAATVVLLTGVTVWTYLGTGNNPARILLVIALRLGALLVACFLALRPSLARQDDENAFPSKLLILLDSSQSMNIADEFNNLSRWDNARRILSASEVMAALSRLAAEQRLETVYYQGAEEVRKLDPAGKATGKRTDIGEWLHQLLAIHGKEPNLRGLVLFTDGADNGTRYPTLEQAGLWRGLCPIHVFALGSPTLELRQKDIAFLPHKVFVEPNPIHVKGKFTIRGFVDARGFESSKVKLSAFIDGKLAAPVQWVNLAKTHDNEVKVECDAPVKPGEIKVTLKIDPLPGEVTALNNEVSTYAAVSKQGVSILWVEGRLRLEAAFAIRALKEDKRFQVYVTTRLKEADVRSVDNSSPATAGVNARDWYQLERRPYDVVVIGDISAGRFAGGDPELLKKIREMVTDKGTGLLMLGGKETFGNSDWQNPEARDLTKLLPVEVGEAAQLEQPLQMKPADRGLEYLLRLSDDPQKNKRIWEKDFEPLEGMAVMGHVRDQAEVLARSGGGGEPVLAAAERGAGRTLAFAGEDTYRAWTKNKEAVLAYRRFWRQMMLWLAHQDQAEGKVRVIPDARRVSADAPGGLGFSVDIVGKGGEPVKAPRLQVKVIGPAREQYDVALGKEGNKLRGYFQRVTTPGEYKIFASATTESGTETGEAKFLVYAEDVENLRPAADHELLRKIAQAGRGKFYLADEQKFAAFLDDLRRQQTESIKPKVELWPDWRRNPASSATSDQLEILWNSTALGCFLLFSTFLCVEWFLRRRWGMV